MRLLVALAFAPENNVKYFNQLRDRIQQVYEDDCEEVFDYFENNFIGRFYRNAPSRHAFLSLDIWNMFHPTTQHEPPRTNNSVEGWLRPF